MPDPKNAVAAAAQEDIRAQIVEYIRRNPNAADTCKGVARWWLASGTAAAPDTVKAALESLVETGVLESRRLPSGDSHYRAAAIGQNGTPDQ